MPPLGSKGKPNLQSSVIRVVDGIQGPWRTVSGFTGKQLQVSTAFPALADLSKAIEGNPEAEDALMRLLGELETKGVLAHLTTRHG